MLEVVQGMHTFVRIPLGSGVLQLCHPLQEGWEMLRGPCACPPLVRLFPQSRSVGGQPQPILPFGEPIAFAVPTLSEPTNFRGQQPAGWLWLGNTSLQQLLCPAAVQETCPGGS